MSYQQYLQQLQRNIREVDSDANATMMFWRFPENKAKLIIDMLHFAILYIDKNQDQDFHDHKIREITKWLDNKWHDSAWPCHDVHFHTTFNEYICCPYTCLDEIASTLQKIEERMFSH